MFYPINIQPSLIKRIDAGKVLKSQKLQLSLVSFGMGIVVLLLSYFVVPKMTALYTDMGISLDDTAKIVVGYMPYMAVVLGLMSLYFNSTNFMDKKFEEKLEEYKNQEMINIYDLYIREANVVGFVVVAVVIAILVTGLILPIYSITSSI